MCYNMVLKAGKPKFPVLFLFNPSDKRFAWRVVCRSHYSKDFRALSEAVDYAVEKDWIDADEAKDIAQRIVDALRGIFDPSIS